MALFQWRAGFFATRKDSAVAKSSGAAAHFRFASLGYGTTAILATVAATTSSSVAFGLAIIGLIVAAGTGTAFRIRHGIAVRRRTRATD
jgi:hypothetical protein